MLFKVIALAFTLLRLSDIPNTRLSYSRMHKSHCFYKSFTKITESDKEALSAFQ